MNYLPRIVLIAVVASLLPVLCRHRKRARKRLKKSNKTGKKKEDKPSGCSQRGGRYIGAKNGDHHFCLQTFLKDAAKVNFTAATPVIDSSKIPVAYTIPSQNLFFCISPLRSNHWLWRSIRALPLGE
jgi:hypothetical protein